MSRRNYRRRSYREDGIFGLLFGAAISVGMLIGDLIFGLFKKVFQKKSLNFSKESTPEAAALREALESRGLRVLSEVPDGHKHIDLSIPDARINIEVDGNQHLTDAHQILSDLDRTHYSDRLGYETIRIPNYQINSEIDKIADALTEVARIREAHFLESRF